MADGGDGGAGASKTYPVRAGELKKGHYVCIKDQPCKVIELTTSKTGKHGHAKANITALNIFNGSKLEEIAPTSHNLDAPFVVTSAWTLIDLVEDGEKFRASLINEEGHTRDDLDLDPTKYSYHATLVEKFKEAGELEVRVVTALDTTLIMPTTSGDGYGL